MAWVGHDDSTNESDSTLVDGEVEVFIQMVTLLNEAPSAVDDSVSVPANSVNQPIDVLANDTDSESDPLTIIG